jgi:hypothetical protein
MTSLLYVCLAILTVTLRWMLCGQTGPHRRVAGLPTRTQLKLRCALLKLIHRDEAWICFFKCGCTTDADANILSWVVLQKSVWVPPLMWSETNPRPLTIYAQQAGCSCVSCTPLLRHRLHRQTARKRKGLGFLF